MRREYFLLPDVESTRKVVEELRQAGIDERRLHVIAREDTPLQDLPEASILEKTDYLRAIEIGLAGGGTVGLIAGLVAISLPPAGVVLGGAGVLYTALAGAGIGAWLSGLIGLDYPDQRLLKFEEAIGKGEILLLVDIPKDRIEETRDAVRKHHPEAEFGGTDPTVPPIIAKSGG
jgi:hypothetical protein